MALILPYFDVWFSAHDLDFSQGEKRPRKGYKELGEDGRSSKVLVHTINGNQTTSMRKSELSSKNFGVLSATAPDLGNE